MLANAYWKRQFGGDRSIVGKAIKLNEAPATVVGVLPDSFDFGAIFDPRNEDRHLRAASDG